MKIAGVYRDIISVAPAFPYIKYDKHGRYSVAKSRTLRQVQTTFLNSGRRDLSSYYGLRIPEEFL